MIGEIKEWRKEAFDDGVIAPRPPIESYNMPSSKGLEGHVVFVVGVTDGLMPRPDHDLQEQARLFYVAMTRAKRKLHLFSSRSRPASITFRPDSYQMVPSPFAQVIPATHLESRVIYPKKKKKKKVVRSKRHRAMRTCSCDLSCRMGPRDSPHFLSGSDVMGRLRFRGGIRTGCAGRDSDEDRSLQDDQRCRL